MCKIKRTITKPLYQLISYFETREACHFLIPHVKDTVDFTEKIRSKYF